ncbi:unnamed protein product [Moneuplotes crassus]|uniref:Uncharacterized protein n=1 Tax=Euplotes crassus TaxID=5936 RepID=A0AAD2D3A7_EUPCR|nr:unnamed protein product [Moneuplotes crassus]
MQSQNQELIDLIHSEFPAVNKLTIQNEVRKNKGDLKDARKTVQSISDSIAEADAILGEEQKEYQDSSSSDEGESESYESQDENDEEEISKICTPKVDNYLEESKEKVEQQSEEIYADLANDLIEKFPGVPTTCVEECFKFFYPNLGKIELVLGEFQKQWVMYSQDFDGYKRGKGKRRERAKKEGKRKDRSETKRGKKSTKDIDHDVNPELAAEIDKIQELLDNDMNDLSKDEIKTLKGNLRVMKKEIRGLRKEHKKKLKDERKAIKSEAKKLKKEEREKIKHEKRLKREEETKKRSMKNYKDDVFFREVREEPTIIKQYLKETKKDLKRARKEGE